MTDKLNRKEYEAKWRLEHRDYVLVEKKRHYQENKEAYKNRAKLWQENNRERKNEISREFRKRHPGRGRAATSVWILEHPWKRAEYKRTRRNREYGADGSHTEQEWLSVKAMFNFTCPCCLQKEPAIKLTEDHITPLSKGGSDHIENIQPLCGPCNSFKHTKDTKYEPADNVNMEISD